MKTGLLKNPVKNSSPKDEKLKALGLNSGNLVFWESIQRLFSPINISYSESDKISGCERMIITDLIWIRENAEYTYLENIIDRYNIPFVPISIGLQCNYYKKDFKFAESTIRLLKKLEERAVLGVRGEYTADILNKYGIKNIAVIGCPSMYYWNNPNLIVEKPSIENFNCSANFKTFYGKLSANEKHFLSYCAHKDMQFVEQTAWEFSRSIANDDNYFKFINEWIDRRKVLPCDYTEWCNALKGINFSWGGRFHGNVIALWNSIPALFLTVDSRTKELTDFFRLPAIDLNSFNAEKPIGYYYDKADYSKFNKYYPALFKNFIEFANNNGLEFCHTAKPLVFAKGINNNNHDNTEIIDIHFTDYRKPNSINLVGIIKSKNKIQYSYEVEGEIVNYFSNKRQFTIEYDCNIEEVPDSVAALPFVALMLPVCWTTDSNLLLDQIDEDFYNSIENIKRGYSCMYPQMNLKGKITVNHVVRNRVDHNFRNALCFFSGGVDATSTMLSNLRYRPELFTIWGTDIFFETPKAWEIAKEANRKVANEYSLRFSTVKTAFRYILNEDLLTLEIAKKQGTNWWYGFQHGIALLAHAAPYAYINNITDIIIASSYSAKDNEKIICASYPYIDEEVEFCGCKIYHDGFGKSRIDKIRQIVDFAKRNNKKFNLRVCWQEVTGKNCCVCEKCQRTIFGIYAVGGNPCELGFNINDDVKKQIINSIKTNKFYNHSFWDSIKISLYEQKEKYSDNELIAAFLEYQYHSHENN